MQGIEYSYDNFKSGLAIHQGWIYGKAKVLNFTFFKTATSTLYFKAFKSANIKSQVKAVTFNIEKSNQVKIIGLNITSFDGINASWDPEYNRSDPNRLAGVRLSFKEVGFLNAFIEKRHIDLSYETLVKKNQGN